jgi:hypothetical protein
MEALMADDPNDRYAGPSPRGNNLSSPMEQLVMKPVLAKVDVAVARLRDVLEHADELLARLGPEELACLATDYFWMSIPALTPRHRRRSDLVRLALSLEAA